MLNIQYTLFSNVVTWLQFKIAKKHKKSLLYISAPTAVDIIILYVYTISLACEVTELKSHSTHVHVFQTFHENGFYETEYMYIDSHGASDFHDFISVSVILSICNTTDLAMGINFVYTDKYKLVYTATKTHVLVC